MIGKVLAFISGLIAGIFIGTFFGKIIMNKLMELIGII